MKFNGERERKEGTSSALEKRPKPSKTLLFKPAKLARGQRTLVKDLESSQVVSTSQNFFTSKKSSTSANEITKTITSARHSNPKGEPFAVISESPWA